LAAVTFNILRGTQIYRCVIQHACQHDSIKCFTFLN
jgi:hypothetical protein